MVICKVKNVKSIQSREQYCKIINENKLEVFDFNHLYDLIDVARNIDIMKARMIEYQPDKRELNIKMYENYQYELSK